MRVFMVSAGACALSAALAACGSDESNGAGGIRPTPDAALSSGGRSTGAGGTTGGSGQGGPGGAAGSRGCERFGFIVSGNGCASTGCSSFSCACSGSFPKGIATCSPDGCITGADCTAVCAEDLGAALACTGTYTIAPTGSGGTGGAAGSGGSAGADASTPVCAASDVKVPPTSAIVLGASLTYGKLLSDETFAQYVAGTVPSSTSVDFGGGALPSGPSLVLVKLGPDHKHVWSRRFGSTFGLERVTAFSFAGNGDLLLSGITGMQTDLGGGAAPAASVPQVFVARYDRSGVFVRAYVTPAANSVPLPVSVIEAPSGDLFVFGNFDVAWTVGSTTLTPAGTSGEQDMFMLHYAAAGSLVDARRYGRARNDLVYDGVGGPDGSMYLAGFSFYAVDFGKNPVELGTGNTSWLVRLDASLSPVWTKIIGGGSGCYPRRLWLDGTTLVVAGDSSGRISYGDMGDGGSTVLPQGNLFVLRVDSSDGTLVRGDTYEQQGFGARVTALGRLAASGVAIGGYIQPPADFGGGTLTTSVKSYQPFVARYDGNGQHLWSTLFCGTHLAGGADGAIAGIASDADSVDVLMPFDQNLELGSQEIRGNFGTVLADMPKP